MTDLDSASRALHLVQRPDPATLAACRAFCRPGDAVVLVDTGVLALCAGDGVSGFPPEVGMYCLHPDALAHGMAGEAASRGVVTIEDADLVRLVMDHRHCLGWK